MTSDGGSRDPISKWRNNHYPWSISISISRWPGALVVVESGGEQMFGIQHSDQDLQFFSGSIPVPVASLIVDQLTVADVGWNADATDTAWATTLQLQSSEGQEAAVVLSDGDEWFRLEHGGASEFRVLQGSTSSIKR